MLFDYYVRNNRKHGLYRSWGDISTILLLFESDYQEKNEEVKIIVKDLIAEGKSVLACGYVHKKKADTATLDSYMVLDKGAFNLLCRPKAEVMSYVRRSGESYDVIIDLSTEQCLQMKYLLMAVEAKMRCGRQVEDDLYDLMIAIPEKEVHSGKLETAHNDEKELYEQIKKYLRMIKGA